MTDWIADPNRVAMTRDAKLITARALDADNKVTEQRITTPHPLTPHVGAVIDPSFFVERRVQALAATLGLDADGMAEWELRYQELLTIDLAAMESDVRGAAQGVPVPPLPNRAQRRNGALSSP